LLSIAKLADGADHAHADAAAGRHAELDLVEQAEPHLGVGEDHLHVAARHVLEKLDVDVVARHRHRQQPAQVAHELLGLLLLDLPLRHHFAHAHVEGLELEQQEHALEHRDLHFAPAHVGLPDIAPALGDGGGAAVVDLDLFERLQIHLEVEPVGRVLGQDEVHVGRIDAREVALLQQVGHLLHEPLLHDRALLRAEGARLEQIAVGAERLVGLLQVEQLHGIGVAAPVIEVAQEAARLHRVAVRPEVGGRQPVHQGMAGDGQELLAAACGCRALVRVLRGDRDGSARSRLGRICRASRGA
jgi:hypothetical protein